MSETAAKFDAGKERAELIGRVVFAFGCTARQLSGLTKKWLDRNPIDYMPLFFYATRQPHALGHLDIDTSIWLPVHPAHLAEERPRESALESGPLPLRTSGFPRS